MKKGREEPQMAVELKRQEWEKTLEGECVLHCVLTWPELVGTWNGLGAVNRYYRHAADAWRRRWEREVYCRACLDLADRRAQGRSFRAWQVELATQVTFQEGCLFSLWQEGRETWGYDKPLLLRRGDTWSLEDGVPRTLASFFSKERRWKRQVLEQVKEQMEQRLASGESLLDVDCIRRLRREFDPDRYYLTREGARVFFPVFALAPGGEGVPSFLVTLPRE